MKKPNCIFKSIASILIILNACLTPAHAMKRACNPDSEINPKKGIMKFLPQHKCSKVDEQPTPQSQTYHFSPFGQASTTDPKRGFLCDPMTVAESETYPESSELCGYDSRQILNSRNLDTYFEIEYSLYRCTPDICYRRLLVRPIRGDLSLPEKILTQYLNERKEDILEKLKIEESEFMNALDIFDLIAIDIDIPTDIHHYIFSTDKWIMTLYSTTTLQPVHIKKEFIRIAKQRCPQIENLMTSYAFFPG